MAVNCNNCCKIFKPMDEYYKALGVGNFVNQLFGSLDYSYISADILNSRDCYDKPYNPLKSKDKFIIF